VAVLGISLAVLVVEVVAGLLTNSLALLADAGHVFTDVAGISFALFAIWMAARPPDEDRTWGLYRAEILAAALNAVLLFAVSAIVLLEAWRRLADPPEVSSGPMLAVALLGLAANGVSARVLHEAQARSLNMRGAYLEVIGDILGSLAVVAAAAVIAATGFRAADPLASAVIALLILPRTWALLREAVDILLEKTPRGIEIERVRSHILQARHVLDVHDLHAWRITSGLDVVSAHVVITPDAEGPSVLDELCRCLADDFDVAHCTFQLEREDRRLIERHAHP
jgi:cobalt-zinc-cadmium efflux system protein